MHILITGSVGTGKTTVSNSLSQRLGIPVFHLSDIIVQNGLYKEKDMVFDSYVPDEDALIAYFRSEVLPKHKSFIIDHHSFDIFSGAFFDLVFVMRTDLKTLRGRLEQREYSEIKIQENLECEIMEVVSTEAFQRFRNVAEIQNNVAEDLQAAVEQMYEVISQFASQEPFEEDFRGEEE